MLQLTFNPRVNVNRLSNNPAQNVDKATFFPGFFLAVEAFNIKPEVACYFGHVTYFK